MADDNKVQVSIEAQTDQAKAALQGAAASAQASFAQLQNTFTQASAQAQQTTTAFQNMSTQISGALTNMKNEVSASVGVVTSSLTRIGEVALAIGAVLAGGKILKGAVDEFVNLNLEAKRLSAIMGLTMADAGALMTTFKRFGVDTDTATRGLIMMTRQLKNNEDGFNQLGIKTRDATGNLLPMQTVMFNAINNLKDYKEGTDRTEAAMVIFGRQVSQMPGFLRMTTEALDETKKRMQELGIELSEASLAKARAYQEGMHDVSLVFDALKYKIGEEVLPTLIKLGVWFAGEGPSAVKTFANALINLAATFELVKAALLDFYNRLSAQMTGMKTEWSAWLDVLKATTTLKWEEIAKAWERGNLRVKQVSQQAMVETTKIYEDALNNINKLLSGLPAAGTGAGGSAGAGTKSFAGAGKGGGGAPSIVEQWQAELDQLKLANKTFQDNTLAMERSFWAEKLSLGKTATEKEIETVQNQEKTAQIKRLELERTFWKEKLSLTSEGSKEQIEVQHKIVALEQAIGKQRIALEIDVIKQKLKANQDDLKNQEGLINQQMKMRQLDLTAYKENLSAQVKLGQLSKTQELLLYKQYLLKKQMEDLKDEERTAALYKGDELKYREHLRKLELLKKQQQVEINKIDNQIKVEQQTSWGDIFNYVQNGFSQLFNALTSGTADMAKTLTSIFKSLFNDIAGSLFKWFLDIIKNYAAQAFAAAYAATCAIPIVGPELAPEVATTAFAGTMAATGFLGMASYQAGAWEIPHYQLAALHPGEMVVPAGPAEAIRRGEGSTGPITVNLTQHFNADLTQAQCERAADKMIKAINWKIRGGRRWLL